MSRPFARERCTCRSLSLEPSIKRPRGSPGSPCTTVGQKPALTGSNTPSRSGCWRRLRWARSVAHSTARQIWSRRACSRSQVARSCSSVPVASGGVVSGPGGTGLAAPVECCGFGVCDLWPSMCLRARCAGRARADRLRADRAWHRRRAGSWGHGGSRRGRAGPPRAAGPPGRRASGRTTCAPPARGHRACRPGRVRARPRPGPHGHGPPAPAWRWRWSRPPSAAHLRAGGQPRSSCASSQSR